MAEPMLSVYNINVWYGAIHAIKDISFNVNEGEIVALIGANGAGKSTTLKTVSGLLRSKTGSIKFMGEDITHTPADKLVSKGLAQVPEGRRAFLQMTVEENLEMGAYTQPKSTVAPGLERVYEQFPRLKARELLVYALKTRGYRGLGLRVGTHLQILLDRHLQKGATALGNLSQALAHQLVGGRMGNILAHKLDGAGFGAQQARDGLKRR